MLTENSILVTGGTGSFGKSLVRHILNTYPDIERLVIYSRDELKQSEMAQEFDPAKYPALRYFIGDVRDRDRLKRAVEGIKVVIHAAALKQVPAAEYNPFEFIKTNVIGAQNLIEVCMDQGVSKVIALSTDKAAAPINLYGATKLCADKLFTTANNISGNRNIRFSVVRYGNVMGSRGSVIPFFLKCRNSGRLPITDPAMTRFNISLDDSVAMVMWALSNALGGEIFVPKIPSYRILDMAKAIGPDCEYPVVGVRPGEKIHEEMITLSDGPNTMDLGNYYAIVSSSADIKIEEHATRLSGTMVKPGFIYNSGTNDHFLTIEELRKLIEEKLQLKL